MSSLKYLKYKQNNKIKIQPIPNNYNNLSNILQQKKTEIVKQTKMCYLYWFIFCTFFFHTQQIWSSSLYFPWFFFCLPWNILWIIIKLVQLFSDQMLAFKLVKLVSISIQSIWLKLATAFLSVCWFVQCNLSQ